MKRVLLLCVFAVIATMVMSGCRQKTFTDEELVQAWTENESLFGSLSAAYVTGHVSCPYKNDPHTCVFSDAEAVLSQLRRRAHIKSAYVKKTRGADDGIWLPIQTHSLVSMSSSTRGYAYLDNAPTSTVADTLGVHTKGSHFKLLGGHWYIFVTNQNR